MKNYVNLLVWGMTLLMMASCQHVSEEINEIHLSGTLSVRASCKNQTEINGWEQTETEEVIMSGQEIKSRAESNTVSRLAFALIDGDGNIVVEQEKTSADDDYLIFNAVVPVGDYTLIAFGHSGTGNVSISPAGIITPPSERLTDSFLFSESIHIDENSKDKNIVLNRCVAMFSVFHTDVIPSNAASVEISWSGGGRVLDAETSLAKETTEQSVSITVPSSALGSDKNIFGVYTLLPDEECTIDVEVLTKGADGATITQHHLSDVPMELNRKTIYSGVLFHASQALEATFNTEWKPDINFEF